MPEFGSKSKNRLRSVHPDLCRVLEEAIKVVDFTILQGFRGKAAQNEAFDSGKSKLRFPDSKHNTFPSLAVDFAPWPIDWQNIGQFEYVAGVIAGCAQTLGVPVRLGRDWDRDGLSVDERFKDYGHVELVTK